MAETIAPDSGASVAPKGLLARFVGVLLSPRSTYADIVRRPKWIGVFLLIVVISAGCGGWLSTTEVGRRAALEAATKMTESLGVKMPEAGYNRMRDGIMEASAARMIGQAAIASLIFVALGSVVLAGMMLGIFNALLGGDATFKQVFAVVVHSQAVLAVKTLFTTPLNYARESLSNPTSLAALLPMLDENGLPARLLGSIDLFWLWWITTLAIGLAVLYRRQTRATAVALIGVYVGLAVLIALGLALVRGSGGS